MSAATRRWLATAGATLISISVLDAISAATGMLLVASALLHEADWRAVLAVLVGSYVLWGMALRQALRANLDLLERTGTSTSLPSKLAHSLAAARSGSAALCRMAASAGYVLTEIAKEAPYYLGATGAALMTDAVTSREAMTFLAGANLGAAGYESGLAQIVRLALARKAPPYSSFETDWNPGSYLRDYYAAVEPDERETIAFMVDASRTIPQGAGGIDMLIFGSGPTLHHVFPFVARARVLDVTDFLPANLAQIRHWIRDAPEAHDWRPFVRHTLACEGGDRSDAAVAAREALARRTIGSLWTSDLRDPATLLRARRAYDVVIAAYCADSVTADHATWVLYMQRIAGLVRPGGTLVVAALLQCRAYEVGGRLFPSANVSAEDMRAALSPLSSALRVEAVRLPARSGHGYDGIVLAQATVAEESGGGSPRRAILGNPSSPYQP